MTLLPEAVAAVPPGDSDLLTRARDGDAGARDELLLRFRQPIYVAALQMLGNREDALDVTQDSLLRFVSTLDRFKDGYPIKPWLLTIARNRARDLLRRRKVRRAEPLPDERADYDPSLIDRRADTEAMSRQNELRGHLWRALSQMPDQQREILVLRDYQDQSYAELATILGVPIGTVMSRLHRARQSLRRLLEDDFGPTPKSEPRRNEAPKNG